MENRIFNVKDFEKEDKDIAVKTLICNTDASSTVVWVVKPGQSVKCHMHDNADDMWIITEGEGMFHCEVGKSTLVKAGQIILNKAGDCHGLTNHTDKNFKFIGVLTTNPANYTALE